MPETELYDTDILIRTHRADTVFVQYMISLFVKHMPESSSHLQKACDQNDWQTVRFYAHKMKASIDLFNLEPLKAVIRGVEERARKSIATDTIPKDVDYITTYVANCVNAMKRQYNLN